MDAIVIVLMRVIGLFPSSPVSKMLEKIDMVDIFGNLNFFIPFDFCALATEIWLACVIAYYAYSFFIKKI